MLQSITSRSLKPSLYANQNQSDHQRTQSVRGAFKSSSKGADMITAVAEFVVSDEGRVIQRIQMHTPAAMIGRTGSADIQLSVPVVSRQHARLARVENEYWLIDLNSTNGTKVNDRYISSVALRDGDIITFGTESQSAIEILFRINN